MAGGGDGEGGKERDDNQFLRKLQDVHMHDTTFRVSHRHC
jgi:hypothetical protein